MTKKTPGGSLIAPNKKARHLYEILETLEAGLVLTGTEVKSLRAGQVSFRDSYVTFKNHEAWLVGLYIAPYQNAGYARHDPDADRKQAEKLAASPKDRAENLMIVDLMRNDIGRVAVPGSVRVPELFVVEPFPAVHHLVSTITARLPDSRTACDLLRAAFPGGSITGAPKVRAMEIIDELEPHRRNAWCGSIGYISLCGTLDTSITIRTLTACNGNLYCSAGGGIVADSEVDAEYQETFDKVNRILKLLE